MYTKKQFYPGFKAILKRGREGDFYGNVILRTSHRISDLIWGEKKAGKRKRDRIFTYSLCCSTNESLSKISLSSTTFSTNNSFPQHSEINHFDSARANGERGRGAEGRKKAEQIVLARTIYLVELLFAWFRSTRIDGSRRTDGGRLSSPSSCSSSSAAAAAWSAARSLNASLTVVEATPYWTGLYLSRSQGPASKVWLRWYWFGPRDVTRPHGGRDPPSCLAPSAQPLSLAPPPPLAPLQPPLTWSKPGGAWTVETETSLRLESSLGLPFWSTRPPPGQVSRGSAKVSWDNCCYGVQVWMRFVQDSFY